MQDVLLARARAGAGMTELVRALCAHHGLGMPSENTILVLKYLTKTFDIPLLEARQIEAWVAYERAIVGSPVGKSNEEIDLFFEPFLGRFRNSWPNGT